MMAALPPQQASAQDATISSDDIVSLSASFPLRIDDPLRFQQCKENSEDIQAFLGTLREAMNGTQSLPNGNPFPEAVSLDKFLEASFRTQIQSVSVQHLSIETLKSQMPASDVVADIFAMKDILKANAACFTLYEIIDSQLQFCSLMIQGNGGHVEYMSGLVSMFALPAATDAAVHYFLEKRLIGRAMVGQTSIENQAGVLTASTAASLPAIQPWNGKEEYEGAQKAFKFAIGGAAISLCATFVAAGLWQMYREAAYRNSVFNDASTISGIATGTCAAVTAAFLAFVISNATTMLRVSQ